MKQSLPIIAAVLFTILLVPADISAQNPQEPPAPSGAYQLLVDDPTTREDDIPFISKAQQEGGGLRRYLKAFFQLGLAMAVLLSIVIFTYNGVLYMTSDVIGKKGEAKNGMTSAVIGLVLAFSVWLILRTINPALVNFRLFDTLEEIGERAGEPPETSTTTTATTTPPDGQFTYQAGIEAQRGHAAPQLESLLSCMAGKVPGNVGEISSISDSMLVSGGKTWEECAAGECQHRKNSNHYGGISCIGKSYAVDFGDEQNFGYLQKAAKECVPLAFVGFEGNHTHISIGSISGCGGGI